MRTVSGQLPALAQRQVFFKKNFFGGVKRGGCKNGIGPLVRYFVVPLDQPGPWKIVGIAENQEVLVKNLLLPGNRA